MNRQDPPDAGVTARDSGALLVRDHELRAVLAHEVHARPSEMLAAPVQATHLAMLSSTEEGERERALIADLCARYRVHPPGAGHAHFSADLDVFRLRWERHTEFSSFTFLHAAPFERPFAVPAIARVPADWLRELPGRSLVAVHVAVEPRTSPERPIGELADLFASNTVVGSRVSGGAAAVWTDFRIHADGFGRILVHDVDLSPRQTGRLVQRLLEIETYRMLALLALPAARRHTPGLARLDERLAALAGEITRAADLGDEQRLLGDLSRLAAEVEGMAAGSNYRFGASAAYFELVERRVEELREERIAGLQTIAEFMERRLAPAARTCESLRARLQSLSTRVARASDLLRTRVNISTEAQMRDLLHSMDRRAHLQLRLQETVEGLSVVVLSYYLVGLVRYGLEGLEAAGVAVNVNLLAGAAVPVVVAAVFLGIRHLRRRLARQSDGDGARDGGDSPGPE